MSRERLQAIVDRIEADPSCWDQSKWHCGTAHCIGGWAQIDAGKNYETLEAAHMGAFDDGMEWLNLSDLEAVWLFSPDRTLAEIKAFLAGSAEWRL